MKKSRLLLVLALLIVGALIIVPRSSAHDGEDHSDEVHAQEEQSDSEQAEQPAESEAAEENAAAYNYVAQEGDSYSVLARKAIQTYGINNGVNLSGAEIVAAETNLTRTAGSPELSAGQEVSITESDVKQWVDAAQALTDAEEANWDYYVQFVDFNTDAAGEPRT